MKEVYKGVPIAIKNDLLFQNQLLLNSNKDINIQCMFQIHIKED